MAGLRTLLLLVIPVALAAGILAGMGKRGTGVFKKQGVAWGLTLLMVFAAIGIGYAKAPYNYGPAHVPDYPAPVTPGYSETVPPASVLSYVRDDAGVLSSRTVRELDQRNDHLIDWYGVAVAVVTCNYGRDDLDQYALKCAEEMGLSGYDFIVALDISGDNYWLIQGADLVADFSDDACSNYAYDYMEKDFAAGDYDSAVLKLADALERWYGVYYSI